jgi:hypothetical protein
VLLKYLYGQCLIAGQLLQLAVLFLQLLDSLNFCDPQVGIHFLLAVEGLFGNTVFSEDFFVRGGFFCFPENGYDLFCREPFLGHLSFHLTAQTNILAGLVFGGKVTLWRYLEDGVIPEGAVVKAQTI